MTIAIPRAATRASSNRTGITMTDAMTASAGTTIASASGATTTTITRTTTGIARRRARRTKAAGAAGQRETTATTMIGRIAAADPMGGARLRMREMGMREKRRGAARTEMAEAGTGTARLPRLQPPAVAARRRLPARRRHRGTLPCLPAQRLRRMGAGGHPSPRRRRQCRARRARLRRRCRTASQPPPPR